MRTRHGGARTSDPRDGVQQGCVVLREALGVPLDSALLERSLTHRSYAYENGGLPTNERLEFLGDSVLGLVVTNTLFLRHPELPEGQLAKLRAAVVNMRALAHVGRALQLGRFVRLGKGEEATGGRDKSSILADTLEAIIGAVYLDRGLDEAAALVHRLFDPLIEHSANLGAGLDWKTSLQELAASTALGVPEYVVQESGPDHEKYFRAVVHVGAAPYGEGSGRSKKEAEQQAAEAAWTALRAQTSAATEGPSGGVTSGAAGGTAARVLPHLPPTATGTPVDAAEEVAGKSADSRGDTTGDTIGDTIGDTTGDADDRSR